MVFCKGDRLVAVEGNSLVFGIIICVGCNNSFMFRIGVISVAVHGFEYVSMVVNTGVTDGSEWSGFSCCSECSLGDSGLGGCSE